MILQFHIVKHISNLNLSLTVTTILVFFLQPKTQPRRRLVPTENGSSCTKIVVNGPIVSKFYAWVRKNVRYIKDP